MRLWIGPKHRFAANWIIASAVLLSVVGITATSAEDFANLPPKERGFEVAAQSDRSDNGFGANRVSVVMTLHNSAGQETTRKMEFSTLERENEDVGDKSLVVFSTPRDVEGTALLSHAKILVPDDQWLFLPALGRIRRISSANKSGPFVGSEFAFEDFTGLELNKYEYNWIGEEELDGIIVDVVERFPRYENSGYTKQIAYTDRDVFQLRKLDFFDRRGDLLKTLELTEYREYGEGIWRSHLLIMTNHHTNKSTDLVYGTFDFDTGLTDRDFDRSMLDRIH